MIVNRRNLEYTFKNVISYQMWFMKNLRCCPCRSKQSIKKLKAPVKDVFLNKGEARLAQDLDIVKLLGKIHVFEDIKKAIFDHRESALLQFSRKAVISTGTETSGSDA